MKKPTFLLKPSAYKTDKLYAIIPDDGTGDATVSGYVGNGTRVNKDGLIETVATDTPRIDYLNKPGLLSEPTRTNLIPNSSTISGSWALSNTTKTVNDTIAPDGSLNGDKLEDTSTGSIGQASRSITLVTAGATHTFSFFIKFGDLSYSDFGVNGNTTTDQFYIRINDDGTMTTTDNVDAILKDSGSQYYGCGWWRFWGTFTCNVSDTVVNMVLRPASTDIARKGYCWYWGFQLERYATPSSIIPTSGSTAQRVKDTISITDVITPNEIIADTNCSIFIDLEVDSTTELDSSGALFILGTTNGYIAITGAISPNTMSIDVESADGTNATYNISTNRAKILFNVFGDTTEVWYGGVKVIETTKAMNLTADLVTIDAEPSPIKIYEVSMFNKVLTDTESQSLTA